MLMALQVGGRQEALLDRNEFGFVFGGLIVEDKVFFVLYYEGFCETRKSVVFQTVRRCYEAPRHPARCWCANRNTGALDPVGNARLRRTSFVKQVAF